MDLGAVTLEIRVKTQDLKRSQQDLTRLADAGAKTDNAQRILQTRMAALERASRAAGAEYRRMRQSGLELNSGTLRLVSTLRSAEASLNGAGRSIARFAGDSQLGARGVNSAERSVRALHGTMISFRNIIAVIGITRLARETVELGLHFQTVRQQLLSVFGTTQQANQQFAYLMTLSDRLGANFFTLADAYNRLSAAAKGTSMEGQRTRDIFEAFAMTGTVFHFSTQQMGNALLAVEQMISKGRVQSEELRRQLGNVLPGAMGIFVRAYFGVGQATVEQTQKFGDLMKKGQILSEELLPKVAKELQRVFGPGLISAQNSAQANLQRMQNAWARFALSVWDSGLQDAIKTVAMAITDMLNSQGVHQFGVLLGQSILVAAKAFYALRNLILPATAALMTFVAVFSAGAALGGMSTFLKFATGGIGAFASLAAVIVAATTALGMFGGKAASLPKTYGTGDIAAKLTGEASSGTLHGGTFDDSLVNSGPVDDKALQQAAYNLKYKEALDRVNDSLRKVTASTAQQAAANDRLDWGKTVLTIVGVGVAWTVMAAKVRTGLAALSASGGLSAIGAKIGAAMPAGVVARWTTSMRAATAATAGLGVAATRTATAMAFESGVMRASAPVLSSVVMGTARAVGAFGTLQAGLGLTTGALAAFRTVGMGLFTLMGGWVGILLGVGVALGALYLNMEKKRKAAFTMTKDEQQTMDFLKAIGSGGSGAVAAGNTDVLLDKAKDYSNALGAQEEFNKNYATGRQKFIDQLKYANEDLKKAQDNFWKTMDGEGQGGPRGAFGQGGFASVNAVDQLREAISKYNAEAGKQFSSAINNKDIDRAAALVRQVEKLGGFAPGVKDTADRFVNMAEGVDKSQEKAKGLTGMLHSLGEAMGIVSKNSADMAANMATAIDNAKKFTQLGADDVKMIDNMQKGLEEYVGSKGATGYDLDMYKLEEARKKLTASGKPDPDQIARIDANEKLIAQAKVIEAAKNAERDSRREDSHAQRQFNIGQERDQALASIQSVLDPVQGQVDELNVQAAKFLHQLVRGGVEAKSASALVDKYKAIKFEEITVQNDAAAAQLEQQFSKATGNNYAASISEIDMKMSQYSLAAHKAGMSQDELNKRLAAMTDYEIKKAADSYNGLADAMKAAEDAQGALFSAMSGGGENPFSINRDADRAIEELIKQRRTIVDRQSDPAEGAAMLMQSVKQEEAINQLREYRLTLYQRDFQSQSDLNRLMDEYISKGAQWQQQMNHIDFLPQGKQIEAAKEFLRSNPTAVRQIIPDGDAHILAQLPALMDRYGQDIGKNSASWYAQIKAIYDAIKAAEEQAQKDFGNNLRKSPTLTSEEINAAANRGAQRANTDSVVDRFKNEAEQIRNVGNQLGDDLSTKFTDIFKFDGSIKSFKDFLVSVINMFRDAILEMIRISVVKPLIQNGVNALMSFAGMAVGGASHGAVAPGGVHTYSRGGLPQAANDNAVRAFGRGSDRIHTSPKYFSMGGNKRGVLGESGPEAIMPMTSSPEGGMGVRAMLPNGASAVLRLTRNRQGYLSVDLGSLGREGRRADAVEQANSGMAFAKGDVFADMFNSDSGRGSSIGSSGGPAPSAARTSTARAAGKGAVASVVNEIHVHVEGGGDDPEEHGLKAGRAARSVIEGIAADVYLKMGQPGNGNNKGVSIGGRKR